MSIEKIVVKIGDREVELTMDEARDLWADLDELFSAPKTDFEKLIPYMPPDNPPGNPYTIPANPTIPSPWITWC